jgi:hypothetical protein
MPRRSYAERMGIATGVIDERVAALEEFSKESVRTEILKRGGGFTLTYTLQDRLAELVGVGAIAFNPYNDNYIPVWHLKDIVERFSPEETTAILRLNKKDILENILYRR